MSIFSDVAEVVVVLVIFFGFGWITHAFFHRRKHDDLKSQVVALMQELESAKKDQKIVVSIQNYTPQALENLELGEDVRRLLLQITQEGDCGPPEGMSWNRRQLAANRIREKGLIEEEQDGTHPTRLAFEWLDRQDYSNDATDKAVNMSPDMLLGFARPGTYRC